LTARLSRNVGRRAFAEAGRWQKDVAETEADSKGGTRQSLLSIAVIVALAASAVAQETVDTRIGTLTFGPNAPTRRRPRPSGQVTRRGASGSGQFGGSGGGLATVAQPARPDDQPQEKHTHGASNRQVRSHHQPLHSGGREADPPPFGATMN